MHLERLQGDPIKFGSNIWPQWELKPGPRTAMYSQSVLWG